jgi:hypothetical protein
MRLNHRELDDLNVLLGRRLFEELFQERSCRRVDHGHAVERRPRQMNEELMR